MKILKGDKIKVLIGKDKNREGEVVTAYPKKLSVLVKGMNMYKKHIKATREHSGAIVEKERAIGISKIALICPSCKKATRVSYKIDKAGEKTRICQKCQAVLASHYVPKSK